jgi:hypothetical protein
MAFMESNVVLTSFYTNIAVCMLSNAAGLLIFCYIINFCIKEKIRSPKLISVAIFWLSAGFIWLFSGLSILINGFTPLEKFNNIYELMCYLSVIAAGVAITFNVVYRNTKNQNMAYIGASFMAACGVVYMYMLLSEPWPIPIYSDWGMAILPPASVVKMSLFFSGLYALVLLAGLIIEFYKLRKNHSHKNKYEFIFMAAISLFYGGCMFDVVGTPGWRMVIGRIFILSTMLLAFISIYETDYMSLSIKEE